MGEIAKLTEDALPEVARLFLRVLGRPGTAFPEAHGHLRRLYFENPVQDDEIVSYLYRESSGELTGFVGATPRPMAFGDEAIRVAISSNFMVAPERRGGLTGIRLLKRFLDGPQDLSLAEGNDSSKKVWESLGGVTSRLNSLHWVRPLRPLRYVVSVVNEERKAELLELALRPFCAVADGVLARWKRSPVRTVNAPDLTGADANVEKLLELIAHFSRDCRLRPVYDGRLLEWVLGFLEKRTHSGRLARTVCHDERGDVAGWYVTYFNPGRSSDVVQVCSTLEQMPAVLDHLFRSAWENGCAAVTGRIEPRFVEVFTGKRCVLHRCVPWFLVHSKRRDLLDEILQGQAFLTRLESEYWLSMG